MQRAASAGAMSTPPDVLVTISMVAIGFTPIATLALALLDVVPLRDGAPATITAAVVYAVYLAVLLPSVRPRLGRGLANGLVAVLLYDGTRLPFVLLGGWPDFIPRIGVWLLDDTDAHWTIGYLWRFLGNGAGMGLAFAFLAPVISVRIDVRRAGALYGVAIWTGLMLVLTIAPDGEAKMFQLTPATFALSLLGHLVYGGVLGCITPGRDRPVTSPKVDRTQAMS